MVVKAILGAKRLEKGHQEPALALLVARTGFYNLASDARLQRLVSRETT